MLSYLFVNGLLQYLKNVSPPGCTPPSGTLTPNYAPLPSNPDIIITLSDQLEKHDDAETFCLAQGGQTLLELSGNPEYYETLKTLLGEWTVQFGVPVTYTGTENKLCLPCVISY